MICRGRGNFPGGRGLGNGRGDFTHRAIPTRIIYSYCRSFRVDIFVIGMYFLAHVAEGGPYTLRDLGHVSWIGSVLYSSWIAYHRGRL